LIIVNISLLTHYCNFLAVAAGLDADWVYRIVPMNTRIDPKTAPISNGLLKYAIDITNDVNFRKLSTKFSVSEVDMAVIRLTPDMQTYLWAT
jgi:hypothetical protein